MFTGGKAQLKSFSVRFGFLEASVADNVVVLGVAIQSVHGQTSVRVTCVSDLAVTNVNSYVGRGTVTEEHEVTRLQLSLGDFLCCGPLAVGVPRDALAVLAQSTLSEAGAVPLVSCTVGT